MRIFAHLLGPFCALRPAALLTVAVLLGGCAAPLPPRPEVPYGQGTAWKLEKAGLEPSYVLGTMHVSDPEIVRLSPVLEEAFKSARQAAFELLDDDEQQIYRKHRYLAAALLPEDQSLEDLLATSSYAQLIRVARRQRPSPLMIGAHHISRFKPWFVMEVVGKTDPTTHHLDPQGTILDDWLERRARNQKKKVVGLESFEEQLAVMNGLSLADQAALLTAYLDDYDQWYDYQTWAETYLRGDTAMFYGNWLQSLEDLEPEVAKRYAERFLDERNRIMVERALPLTEEDSTFIAVGALHLPGEQGILRLFEQEGFTVTRLQ